MGFFDGGPDDESDARPGDSLRIEAGGIPARAQARLQGLAETEGLFTSALGVNEFALLSELECVPLGQVLGASVHQVGWQYLPTEAQWSGEVFCELDRVSHAWDQARRRAFDRLTEEAGLLGADAVVGVRLRRGEHDWARSTVDYVVVGTGIRERKGGPAGWPVLTDLSGQEYWQLRRAGWAPSALVAATSVFFVSQSLRTQWRRRVTAARNQELNEFTRGFAAARENVIRYLRSQAKAASANGIVGVRLEHRVSRTTVKVSVGNRQRTGLSVTTLGMGGDVPTGGADKRSGLTITLHAVGTAIHRRRPGVPFSPETTMRLGAEA